MRRMTQRGTVAVGLICLCGLAVCVVWVSPWRNSASAQVRSSRSKSKRPSRKSSAKSVKALDVRMQRSRSQFVRDAVDLAREYEKAGQLEKAKRSLEAALKIQPDLPGAKEKIKRLRESILSSNELEFELDVSRGWGIPRARVFAGRAFRIQVEGSYRFVTNLAIGPQGFPTKKPKANDMSLQLPCGALMGVIVTKKKPGKVFPVGTGREMTSKKEGLLFLKVNVPPGHRCTGKLKIRISGYALAK